MNKHLKISGTNIDLTPSFETPLEGYTDRDHPLTDQFRSGVFKEEFHYVNESLNSVCVVTSTGMVIELKGTRRNKKRIVVIRTITFGSDIGVDLDNMQRVLGEESEDFVNYIANTLIREKGNHERIVKLYYVVDVSKLYCEPTGVHLNQLGITLCLPMHVNNVQLMHERKPVAVNAKGEVEIPWGGAINLIHVPESPHDTKPVYTSLGNDVIEIQRSEAAGLAPGLHVIAHGNVRLGSRAGRPESTLVKPNDYKRYGIYESYNELMDKLGGDTRSKDRTAEFISVMKGAFEQPAPKPDNISFLDDFQIGSQSLRNIVQNVGETINVFNKFKNDVKSVAA